MTQELYAVPANIDDFFGENSEELLFSDELFDGNQYTQRINYDYFPPYTGVDSISNDSTDLQSLFSSYLISELRTLSQEYYLFQTTYTTYQFSNGDPFAQPVQVYNNIEGGFGIFAGYSSSFDTLRVTKGLFPSPID